VEFSFWNSRRGVAGGSDAIFYHLVGGRDAIFFSPTIYFLRFVLCKLSGRFVLCKLSERFVLGEWGDRFIHCGLYLFMHCIVIRCAVFP